MPWPSEQDLERVLIKRGATCEDLQQVIRQPEALAAKLDSISQRTEVEE